MSSPMARWVVPLLGIALLLPSANLQRFDGLPLSSPLEFTALVLLVPLLASRALRRLYAWCLERGASWVAHGLVIALALAIGLKVVLLLSGVTTNFLACYETPISRAPGRPCERSYENPFARFGATRIDRHVDFGPETWNLSFVNSLRFNFYPWVSGLPRRDRLPLTATWRGVVARPEPWVARMTYVGEGTVTLAGATYVLPARYGLPNTVELRVPAGRNAIVVHYRFDDGARTGQPDPPFSYAQVRLGRQRAHGGEVSVEAARPARAWRLVAAMGDSLIGLALVMLAGFHARLLTPAGWFVALGGALGAGALAGGVGVVSREQLDLMLLAVIAVILIGWPRGRILLASYFAVVAMSIVEAGRRIDTLGTVLYRSAGDDWLTYESHARTMLETWSLRGGEDVFYNMPLYRYLRFAQRVLLGDGDLLLFAAGLAALYFAVVWMGARLRTPRTTIRGVGGMAITSSLIVALVTSTEVTEAVLRPLSETPTWTALLLLFPMLFAARTTRAWRGGSALAGLTAGIRPNQAPAIGFLAATFLAATPSLHRRTALAAMGVFLAISALPLAHNLFYGGRLVPFTTSSNISGNLMFPPSQLLAIGHDPAVREKVRIQLRALLAFQPLNTGALPFALHGLQAVWLVAAAHWRRVDLTTRLLLLWPVVFLAVHVFYQATTYYPRLIVAGYLAMGLVGAYVASGRGWRATAPKERLSA